MEAAQKDPVVPPLLAAQFKMMSILFMQIPDRPDPRATDRPNTLAENYRTSGEKAPGGLTGLYDSVPSPLNRHSVDPSEEPKADDIAQPPPETDSQPPQSTVPLGRYSSRRRPLRNSTRENHLEIARANVSVSYLKPVLKPLACLLGGCALAIGHHIFNSWADGLSIDSGTKIPQVWVLRIGTGLAFAFQTILAASLSFVICQLLWFSARRKYLTVQGQGSPLLTASQYSPDIDTLYQVERGDIWSTVLSNAAMHGPLLVGATLLSFVLPIAAVFTPASLGVRQITQVEEASCVIVAGDFSNVSPWKVSQFYQQKNTVCYSDNSPFDIDAMVARLSEIAFASGTPTPLPEFCGKNCTYKVIVDSMSFECDVNQPLPAGQLQTPPHIPQEGPARATQTFWNATASGDENTPTLPIYVGWAMGSFYVINGSFVGTTGGAYCTPVQNINGAQSVAYNVTTSDQLHPILLPPDKDGCRWKASYDAADWQKAAIALAARRLLLGSLAVSYNYDIAYQSGDIAWDYNSTVRLASFLHMNTSVFQPSFIWKDVVKGIEETAANITASLLNLDSGRKNSTCSSTNPRVVYDYNPANLLAPYGVAIFVVGGSLVFGVFVFLRFNPDDLTTSFADTIGITRNLDMEIFARKRDGQDELKPLLRSTKFRLGDLSGGYVGYGTRQDF
ncbi:hypothetical protein FRC05_003441 [Tulasnella sp. 425]|nr:hypothetical protein FRC05_003441 [Tulasnella sp. 425]